jgi:hypothetical protein
LKQDTEREGGFVKRLMEHFSCVDNFEKFKTTIAKIQNALVPEPPVNKSSLEKFKILFRENSEIRRGFFSLLEKEQGREGVDYFALFPFVFKYIGSDTFSLFAGRSLREMGALEKIPIGDLNKMPTGTNATRIATLKKIEQKAADALQPSTV